MPDMLTEEQILGLATGQPTRNSAQQLAQSQRWQALARHDKLIWGTSPLPATRTRRTGPTTATQTVVDGAAMRLSCTCSSRQFPCPHTLALLLLWQQQPALFTPGQPPAWLPALTPTTAKAGVPPLPLALSPKKFEQLRVGLSAFRRWLTDVMDQGLARLPTRPQADWRQMSNRLVDAGAPELARLLDGMDKLQPKARKPDWPDRFLRLFGRFFLLIEAFERFESLPLPLQVDLRLAVGWRPRRPVAGAIIVKDTWLVTGRQVANRGRRRYVNTWFWGVKTGRPALWRQLVSGKQAIGQALPTGAHFSGPLAFIPGAQPLMVTPPPATAITYDPTPFANAAYSQTSHLLAPAVAGLASGPWHTEWPLLVPAALPENGPMGWQLRTPSGTILPLAPGFRHGWHLLALSGRQPISLFGLWRGRAFIPLSAAAGGRWEDLHRWRNLLS